MFLHVETAASWKYNYTFKNRSILRQSSKVLLFANNCSLRIKSKLSEMDLKTTCKIVVILLFGFPLSKHLLLPLLSSSLILLKRDPSTAIPHCWCLRLRPPTLKSPKISLFAEHMGLWSFEKCIPAKHLGLRTPKLINLFSKVTTPFWRRAGSCDFLKMRLSSLDTETDHQTNFNFYLFLHLLFWQVWAPVA